MSDQPQNGADDGWAKLMAKMRKDHELIDRLNAEFSRPGAWTIGKELGGDWIAAGIVDAMAKQGPRKEVQ